MTTSSTRRRSNVRRWSGRRAISTEAKSGVGASRLFHQAADLSGVVLTKADGTAKGGIAVAIRSDLGIPVKLVGSGERLEDLQPFDARAFARAIFSPEG